jgi:hypothetical protein
MNYREAVKKLEKSGFVKLRNGKGSHAIFRREDKTIVLSMGTVLSSGAEAKVRTAIRSKKVPISQEQVTKEINLQLPSSLPDSVKEDIKKEVGDFVVTSILDYVGQGKSPVTGRGFKQLSKEYAEDKKGGRREPNLDLEGDMLNSLKAETTPNGIEVGIFDSSQAPKAYNHNEGDTLPRRQFIPEAKQRFVGEIEKGINDIVKSRIKDEIAGESQVRSEPRRTPSDTRSSEDIQSSFEPVAVQPSSSNFNIFASSSTMEQMIKDILGG